MMDSTAYGIIIGLVACVAFGLASVYRQGKTELLTVLMVFLAGIPIPGGIALIDAALKGNVANLPTTWREHVAVAGIIAIGFALGHILRSFRGVWQNPLAKTEAAVQLVGETRTKAKRKIKQSNLKTRRA